MKMVKSLLLGSAAGLVAVAGAQAADLPVKAKPVEYVKICSLYGDGFYYIPGSQTCIQFSGYIRWQTGYNVDNNVVHVYGANGAQDRGRDPNGVQRNAYTQYSRFRFQTDVRTQTEYGTLRAFGAGQISNEVDANVINVMTVDVTRAFIQWAGFTFGHFASPADVPFQLGDAGLRSLHQIQTESNTSANGINGIFYTWQLGSGWTFNIGAQDQNVRGIHNASGGGFAPNVGANPQGNGRVGQQSPSPFVSLRVNQAWGAAAISVVAQEMKTTYYSGGAGCPAGAQPGSTQCNYPSNEWGYGARFGTLVNLPWISPGDRAGFAVGYAVGAIRYATNNLASPGLFGSKNQGGNNVAFGWVSDGVYFNTNAAGTGGSDIEKTTAWSVLAGYEHYWSRQWSTTWYGSYGKISYSDTVINSNRFCRANTNDPPGTVGVLVLSGQSCDPGFAYWSVGSHTDWFPVPGMRLAVDVMYTKVETALEGQVSLVGAQGRRPTGIYTAKDLGITSVIFRAQRNWGAGD